MNWDQLKTILWLRWRLMRNQWTRSKGVAAVIAGVVAFGAFVLGGGTFIGGLFGGMKGLADVKPEVIWLVWCAVTAGFLFFWMIGLLQEIQRAETIDFQRLLHLPVALGQIFVINYVASHLALSIIIFVPGMIGLAIGLALSHGLAMLLLLPLSLGMVCSVTAWTYCLRGWLAALMSNPRRRRNVTMAIVFLFVVLGQAPNLYFNVFRRFDDRQNQAPKTIRPNQAVNLQMKLEEFRPFEKVIPPLWVPLGAQGLAEGNVFPALLGTLGGFGIAALGLRRSYRGTMRFYRGDIGGQASTRAETTPVPRAGRSVPGAAGKSSSRFMERKIPGVPEQATALALATLRSLMRAPEVKVAWATSIIVPLLVGGSLLFRSTKPISLGTQPFIVTGAMGFTVFMLAQFFANQFGLDRDGFRAFVLSPIERKYILLGKNVACLPVGACFGGVLLLLLELRLHLSPLTLLGAFLQLIALLLMGCLVGNLISILVPYRIQQGTLKPTKMPGLAMVTIILCHLLFPIAMAPVFVPAVVEYVWRLAGWPSAVPINFILSAGLAGVAGLGYWLALEPMGRLLQRRETTILGVVTTEVE